MGCCNSSEVSQPKDIESYCCFKPLEVVSRRSWRVCNDSVTYSDSRSSFVLSAIWEQQGGYCTEATPAKHKYPCVAFYQNFYLCLGRANGTGNRWRIAAAQISHGSSYSRCFVLGW